MPGVTKKYVCLRMAVFVVFLVAFVIGCVFIQWGKGAGCQYPDTLREEYLDVESDQTWMEYFRVMLLNIEASRAQSGWYPEYEPVLVELKGFMDDADLRLEERRLDIEFKIRSLLK